MNLPKLYAQNSDGSVQHWTIYYNGPYYWTMYGRVGSDVITESERTICQSKNIGKKNETTASEQASLEAEAKWKKKLESGFHTDIAKVNEVKFVEPMLAKKYEDYEDKIKFPVYTQPKLDGIRCAISRHGMFTRNGKEIVSCPHIFSSLAVVFEQFPDLILDGELYNHQFKDNFNKICSLVKKTKPSKADTKEAEQLVQYWVYDAILPNLVFFSRMVVIETIFSKHKNQYIVTVPTYECKSKKELNTLYSEFLELGYEGQMIRLNDIYQNKRTSSLLKRKEWLDDEFEILDVLEGVGNRAGIAGAFMLRAKNGRAFRANLTGGFDLYDSYLKNRKSLVGKNATVKYFCLTPPPEEVPRFGCVLSVRDYE